MPGMKLVIPEMDSAPKAGQKREITCNYWTIFVKVVGVYFHYDNYWLFLLLWYGV